MKLFLKIYARTLKNHAFFFARAFCFCRYCTPEEGAGAFFALESAKRKK
jgi:hypothetical protein